MSALSPRRRSSGEQAAARRARSPSCSTTKNDVDVRPAATSASADREQQPLDAGAEADARRRRPADLLDEAVVVRPPPQIVLLGSRSPRPRTRTSCACSSRGRARAVGVELVAARRRSSRYRRTPGEVLAALVAERARRSVGAPCSSVCTRSLFTSKTLSGTSPASARASSSSSCVVRRRATASSFST